MQNFLFIHIDKKNIRIDFSQIIYIEAVKNYVQIITKEKKYLVLYNMKQLEMALPSDIFRRVHRSFIISIQYITGFDSEFVYLKDLTIPLGREYRTILQETFFILDAKHKPKFSKVGIDKSLKNFKPPHNN